MKSVINKYKMLPIQVRASFWFLICAFLQKGISMISTPIFTRLLTTQEYGQYNVFNSWLGIITIFVSFSLAGGVYAQGLVKFEKERNIFASSIQGLTMTLFLFWTIIYLLFHDFWNYLFNLTTVQMIAMLIMIWTTSVFNLWSNDQRVDYKYKALVIITLIVSIAKPVIGIILVINANDKVTARILGLVLVELIGYSWLSFVQIKKGKIFYSKKYWKYAILFNLPLIPHYLSQIVLNSADRIMISSMVGESEAGIYSLAYSLSSIMTLFNTALMQTLNPWIYKKINEQDIKSIAPIAYLSLIIIAFVNLLLILLAPEAVAIFAPKSYYEAIWIIPPVAMSVYFMYSYDLFAKFAFYYEKTNLVMIASIVGAVVNIILNYIFINIFGYIAAGYTTLICYVIYSIAHYILMNSICSKKCNGIKPYSAEKIFAITISFIILGFAMLFTYNYPLIRLLVIVVIFIVILIERKRIINIFKRLLKLKKL